MADVPTLKKSIYQPCLYHPPVVVGFRSLCCNYYITIRDSSSTPCTPFLALSKTGYSNVFDPDALVN